MPSQVLVPDQEAAVCTSQIPRTPKQYGEHVSNALRAAKFGQVRHEVDATLRAQGGPDHALEFVTSCLDEILSAEPTEAVPQPAMLTVKLFLAQAEALTRQDSNLVIHRIKERAGQLVAACCQRIQHELTKPDPDKAAAKQYLPVISRLAAAYSLEQSSVPDKHLHTLLALLMGPLQSLKQAADLLAQFPQLLHTINTDSLFAQLVAEKLFTHGERLADQADISVKEAWVHQCLRSSRFNLKSAVQAVRRWSLQDRFPELELRWIRSAFTSCLAHADWGYAALLALEDRDMQVALVQQLTDARELTLATDVCSQFNLWPELFPGLPHPLPASVQAAEASRFLPLPLPPQATVLVDTAAKLQAAQAALMQAEAVGVDIESVAPRMQIAGGRTTQLGIKAAMQPALLQVATQDQVFLFDLLPLQSTSTDPEAAAEAVSDTAVTSTALDACLAPVLMNALPYKLGCGLEGDFRDLARGLPSVHAFKSIQGLVDLRQLWTKHAPQAEQWLAEHPTHKGPNMSLTAMAESVLGRPLNKVMQCSNWAARPLSPMQLSYAALDAHASVQILSALQGQSRAAGQPLPDLQSSSSAWSSTPQTGSTGSAKARRRKRCSSEP